MDISHWEPLTLVSRWLLYIAAAGAIGGIYSLYLMRRFHQLKRPLWLYAFIATVLTGVMMVVHFIIRAGAAMEEGLNGMFDPDMLAFLWDSAVGEALKFRGYGAFLLLVGLLMHSRNNIKTDNQSLSVIRYVKATIVTAGALLFGYSFTEAGHATSQSALYDLLLISHSLMALWWIGSLFPLWLACNRVDSINAAAILQRFGDSAVFAVAILVTAGLYMSYQLTGWAELTTETYGRVLLIKVALVGTILTLAAIHKLFLVPQITETQSTATLRSSLLIEKLIGAFVLALTAILTTLVGPSLH